MIYLHSIKLLLLALILLSGCANSGKVENKMEIEAASFGLCYAPGLPENIKITASLKAIDQQTLVATLVLQNLDKEALQINVTEADVIKEGMRQPPAKLTVPKKVEAGARQELVLFYQPINSLYFYQKTGLRGDFAAEYALPLSFIKDVQGKPISTDTIVFCLDQKAYNQLLEKYGYEKKVDILKLSGAFLETYSSKLKAYHQDILREMSLEPSVMLHPEELLINGAVIQPRIYELKDSLYINLRFVNRGNLPVKVKPELFFIEVNNNRIAPVTIRKEMNNKKWVRKGDRDEVRLVYKILDKRGTITLSLKGYQYDLKNIEMPIVHELLPLEKLTKIEQ